MLKANYNEIFADIRKRLDNPKSIFTLHDKVNNFGAIPSGILTIDNCLCGGVPEGRIIEIYGPEASGKTTVTLHFIKSAQQLGYVVYFIDAEHALDAAYAKRIGIEFDSLMLSQPDYGEEALETVRVICESTKAFREKGNDVKSLIVVDSVPALVPKSAFEKYGDEGFDSSIALGAAARMMSQFLPPIVASLSKSNATLIFINQERDKIGVTYGSPITTPGGRALKFFSSLRLRVARTGYWKKGEETLGIKTTLTLVKSKMFSIFNRTAEFYISENGIDEAASIYEDSLAKGIITKSGAWINFGPRKFHGQNDIVDAIRAEKPLRDELLSKITGKQLKLQPVTAPVAAAVTPLAALTMPTQPDEQAVKPVEAAAQPAQPKPAQPTVKFIPPSGINMPKAQ